MDYIKIHDSIISRAKNRNIDKDIYYERHHINPICEGGDPNGETVLLTEKEHRIIHYLRYKITKNFYNFYAYRLIKSCQNRIENAKMAAKVSHIVLKEKDYDYYIKRQSKAGKSGGLKCKNEKLGFHSFTKEQFQENGRKVGTILAEKKIGMFSDEFRKYKNDSQKKKVHTPAGVFNSLTEAAIYYNVVPTTVTNRVRNSAERFSEWYLIEEK